MSSSSQRRKGGQGFGTAGSASHHRPLITPTNKTTVQPNITMDKNVTATSNSILMGLLYSVVRLVTFLLKGFAALVLFGIIVNLTMVLINKTIFDGSLDRYIPANNWKELFSTPHG
ncbi:unnamed protein product [Meganyctiphanes norvegica]|uniref:Uncharacterized protein n=1 Tax=Meganyctiphanes norvegica TaxID=48144 RepID=A0AAV2RLT2_MEGNR